MKLWVVYYDSREAYEEPAIGGVYSSREKALEKIDPSSYPKEFSSPEEGFWSTEDESCYLKEVILDG